VRALLVLHGVLGAVVVGLLTHHAVWSWRARWQQSERYARFAFIAIFLQLSIGFWVSTRFAPQTPLFRFKIAAAIATAIVTLISFVVHRFAPPGPLHRGLATLAAAGAWGVGLLGLALLGR
jgi:hypothetical protein